MKPLFILLGMCICILPGCEFSSHEISPRCNDNVQNGNETGVDCGGDCLPCWECNEPCEMIAGESSQDELSWTTWIRINTKDKCTWPSGDDIDWIEYVFYDSGEVMRRTIYSWTEQTADTALGYWILDDFRYPSQIGIFWSVYLDMNWGKPKDLDQYAFYDIERLSRDTMVIRHDYLTPPGCYYIFVKRRL